MNVSLEPQSEYEYRGLMASAWDLLRGDTADWPDRPFYREIIRANGEPALDVGCGTGRLLLDYQAQGLDVDGVDNSPEMLAICREKALARGLDVRLFHQSMPALDINRRYRTIFVPSSSFQLVTDRAQADETLRRLYRHLQDGGTLVMSIMDVSRGADGAWQLVKECVRPGDGLTIRRWGRSTYDASTQLECTEDRYEVMRDGKVVESEHHSRSPATRNYSLPQITQLMQSAGFAQVSAVSGFTHAPAVVGEALFCVIGTRP